MGIVATVLMIAMFGIFALFLIVMGYELYSFSNTRYSIKPVGRESTYYTNSYEEKDGCIRFRDEFDRSVNLCGKYLIEDRKK